MTNYNIYDTIIHGYKCKNNVKGVVKINSKRKNFTTTIELDLQRQFKAKCAEKGIKMNDLLETIMKMLIQEKLDFSNSEIIISKNEKG